MANTNKITGCLAKGLWVEWKRLLDFAWSRTKSDHMDKKQITSVLYNANCPVCNFEIQHYAQYSDDNKLPIKFDDLNSDARVQWGIDADTAARRLYVLHNGKLTSGISAFLVLWEQMPKYRWLSKVVGLPGVRQIASAIYDHIMGPAIYRWHLRRLRKLSA